LQTHPFSASQTSPLLRGPQNIRSCHHALL
jgi:hypothetical protein